MSVIGRRCGPLPPPPRERPTQPVEISERQVDVSWPDLMRDLTELRAVELTLDGQRYRLRTDLRGAAYHAFAAAGVRPPAVVTPLGAATGASSPPAAETDVELPA